MGFSIYKPSTGWWFGTFFIFPYIGDHNPNWLSYFSEGLKPPTSPFFGVPPFMDPPRWSLDSPFTSLRQWRWSRELPITLVPLETWSRWARLQVEALTPGILWYGYGSIPIHTIFRGMNIHLPAILMFTRGTRFWHIPIWLVIQMVTPTKQALGKKNIPG